jgi:hypothetical protein
MHQFLPLINQWVSLEGNYELNVVLGGLVALILFLVWLVYFGGWIIMMNVQLEMGCGREQTNQCSYLGTLPSCCSCNVSNGEYQC